MTSIIHEIKIIQSIYEKRFGIEKCFQDEKSSGFNIEKTKIRKYERFKRMFFCVALSQLMTVVVGEYISSKNHPIKKIMGFYRVSLSLFKKHPKKFY